MKTPRYSLPLGTRRAPLREAAAPTPAQDAPMPMSAQDRHNMIVALGARNCPGLPWYSADYDRLATTPEAYLLRQLHDGAVADGASCAPCDLDADMLEEAGKRHSAGDQSAIQRAHDALVDAGASCTPMQEAATPVAETRARMPLAESAAPVAEPVREGAYDGTKRTIRLCIIRPGFNTSQSRYYTPAAVESIAAAMRGQKQFLNHPTFTESLERPERSVSDWVSTLTQTTVESDGCAWGTAYIHSDSFRQEVENLAAAGLLDRLGASINAIGLGHAGTIDGCDTFVVEAIDPTDPFRSVDWVTEPGAGGRASLLEAASGTPATPTPAPADPAPQEESPAMDEQDKEKMQALEGQVGTLTTKLDQVLAQLGTLAGVAQETTRGRQVDGFLAKITAPAGAKNQAREALVRGTGELTEDTVREAVRSEIVRAAEILGTDAGVVGFGVGADETPGADSEAILKEAFAAAGLTASEIEIALRGRG